MLTLIDNYDSFTYNLVHFLGELGAPARVYRNDMITVDDVLAGAPEAIVLSPGPCDPDSAGICLELIARAGPEVPILGVCLGHQAIGQVYGGRVVRAPTLMHGKLSKVHHSGTGVFAGIPQDFSATRYHSLIVERASLPDVLEITAETADGVIMGVQHKLHPVHGVQFHPESVLTEHGYRLVDHFLHGVPVAPRPVPLAADGALVPASPDSGTLASNPPPVDLVR
jgi:anthranilate synthase component 2